ncbi:MAG: glutamine amidotransferase [Lachnospiraceae bacterium]|jgi:CobQ-like glutamine amidotransferase family enzyme|nr:glutamine amidotransferase [Lachnospiraceae bacterium]MCI1397173.1 glutamine amidotransferase [Lachnospiraceae bacterium]MCI1422811.1 glutamine amidotransferase [Lachnospiraceae bacterium]MCI1451500.1 glutamine amidotransferase [Lachnospiraceae bacterium]
MELKICHLYPEALNLYGDRGNILCMKKRLAWRGIDVSVEGCDIGEKKDLTQYDLLFIGGGQDFEQEVLLSDLATGKADAIRAAVEDGKTFLCICGGYQMMGHYYETYDGTRCEFLGAVDLYTVGSKTRMIDNYAYEVDTGRETIQVVGFENHSGKTYLGAGVHPLGKVIAGNGNNGEDGTEGVRYKNVFGTYSHGPLLPKNPKLCDLILETALTRKYGSCELSPLPDAFENLAHDAVLEKIKNHTIA